MRSAFTASLVLATSVFGAPHHHWWRGCHRRYEVRAAERYAIRLYSRTASPTSKQLHRLGWLERCQIHPAFQARAREFDRHQGVLRWQRLHPSPVWAIPTAIVMCESGGRNLPPNSADASGYYQIIISTWYNYGGGRFAHQAYLASKAQQDIIASRIWNNGQGASQWVCASLVRWR